MTPKPERRPGDQILDRYCANLSPEDREIAHERLRNLELHPVSWTPG